MKDKKIMVIGLDGGTFTVIDRLIKKNKLPNIKRLIQNGVRSNLISTIQPSSEQAWPSLVTGVNNGKHGIYGLLKLNNDYSFRLVNSLDIKGKTLWRILSEHGKKSIIINVPVTYPAEELNGLLVTGYLTPSKGSEYTFPKNLKKEIKKEVPDYIIDIPQPKAALDDEKIMDNFLKQSFSAIELRYKLASYLLKNHDWDLFFLVFSTSDSVQHKFWSCDNLKYKKVIEWVYIDIDKKIGKLIKNYDKDYIFLVSDHGFTTLKAKISLNTWLNKEGFLKFKNSSQKNKILIKKFLKFFKSQFLIGNAQMLCKWPILNKFVSSLLYNGIDWANTKAFAVSSGNIRINLKGRESKGCVSIEDYEKTRNDLIDVLKILKDPLSKELVCKKIFKKEKVYKGPYLEDAPDIIVLFNDKYKHHLIPENRNEVFLNLENDGNHAMEGILIANGMDIKKGIKLNKAKIIDIAPTILYLLGIPIPKEMDGVMLKEIFV